jgi:hypothetical protein
VVKHGRACHYFLRSISFDLIRGLPQRLVKIGESVSVCRALRPAGRSRHRVAVSCPALMQQSTLLLMISADRMLGHIEHRRPPQVRGSKESRLDCPTLQTLRGPADSDFSCQRRTIVAGSISKEYMAASKWTSHIHLLRWVDRR